MNKFTVAIALGAASAQHFAHGGTLAETAKVQAICDSIHNLNCYGDDLATFGKVGTHTECCQACESHSGCNAWTWDWKVSGNCFLKTACTDQRTDSDAYHSGFSASPAPGPSPTPPSPTPPTSHAPVGCGVAVSGDWPNCGAQFSTEYNFDLTVMMKNAQDVAYWPLWRYDWRATQHPVSGPWTYVSQDWCWNGGVDGRPSPAYDSPGLMGWNEPNVPGQCNANDAADPTGITEFVDLARQYKAVGKFVVSPAPGGGSAWLDTFFAQIKGRGFTGVDYIAYHHYVRCDSDTTGDQMYSKMEEMLVRHINLMYKWNNQGFNIKGVWITEIACQPSGGWANQPYYWEADKPAVLMGKFIDIINNHKELQAWAWFGYGGFGQLWDDKSYALTALGRTYFQNCQGNRAPVMLGDGNVTTIAPNATFSLEAHAGRPKLSQMVPQSNQIASVIV